MTYIERIVVRLAADASQYNRVMDDAAKKLVGTTSAFVRTGTAAGSGFVAAAQKHADQVRAIADRTAAVTARIASQTRGRLTTLSADAAVQTQKLYDAEARGLARHASALTAARSAIARAQVGSIVRYNDTRSAIGLGVRDQSFKATETRDRDKLAAGLRLADQTRQIEERFKLRESIIMGRAFAGGPSAIARAQERAGDMKLMKDLQLKQVRETAATSTKNAEKVLQDTVTRIQADALTKRKDNYAKYQGELLKLRDQESRLIGSTASKDLQLRTDIANRISALTTNTAAKRAAILGQERAAVTAAHASHADQMRWIGAAPSRNIWQGSLIGNLARMGGDQVSAGVGSATGSPMLGNLAGGAARFGALGAAGATLGLVLGGVTMALGLATTASFAFVGGVFEMGRGALHVAENVVKLGADLERTRVSFETMLGAGKGSALLSQVQQLAIRTPFKSNELVKSAEQMLGMGLTANQILPALSRLGDIAAGDAEKLWRLSYAAAQVQAAGRFMGTELRQFTEAGVGVADFAAANNMDTAEFQEAMRNGQIGAEAMWRGINKLTEGTGRFADMNERQLQTVKGQWNSLVETVELAAAVFGEKFLKKAGVGSVLGGITDLVTPLTNRVMDEGAVSKAVEWFEAFRKEIVGFGTDVYAAVAAAFGNGGWQAFLQFFPTAAELARSLRGLMVDVFLTMVNGLIQFAEPVQAAIEVMNFLYKVFAATTIVALQFGRALWYLGLVIGNTLRGNVMSLDSMFSGPDPFGEMTKGVMKFSEHLDGAVRRTGNLAEALKEAAGSVKVAFKENATVGNLLYEDLDYEDRAEKLSSGKDKKGNLLHGYDRQGNPVADWGHAVFMDNGRGVLTIAPHSWNIDEQAHEKFGMKYTPPKGLAAGDLSPGMQNPNASASPDLKAPVPYEQTIPASLRDFITDLKGRYTKSDPDAVLAKQNRFIKDAISGEKNLLPGGMERFARREGYLNAVEAIDKLMSPTEQLAKAQSLLGQAMKDSSVKAREAGELIGPMFDKVQKDAEDLLKRSGGGETDNVLARYQDLERRRNGGLDMGGINDRAFGLGLQDLRQKLQKELVGTIELPKAAFAGTAEAMDQINQIENGQKDTLVSMEELLKRAEERDKKKLDAAERSAKASEESLKNRLVAKGGKIK